VESISRFNPATQRFETCDGSNGMDFAITSDQGYFVHLHEPRSLSVSTTEAACRDLPLQPGLNVVAIPRPAPQQSCYDLLQGFSPDQVGAIQRLNPETGRYESCSLDDSEPPQPVGADFPVRSGEAYLLHVDDAAGMTVNTCGQ
jgi:hypothetical protein